MQFPVKQETLNERNQSLLVTVVLGLVVVVVVAVALHHERDSWLVLPISLLYALHQCLKSLGEVSLLVDEFCADRIA